MPSARKERLLFNPTSIVHYRNIVLFAQRFPEYGIRCVLNPAFPWVTKITGSPYELFFFKNGTVPAGCLADVRAVIVFSAQPRLPVLSLLQDAALRGVPVIAVEEVYQLTLEQGYVNEYFLPVDMLLAGSEHERQKFLEFGVPAEGCRATGCVFSGVAVNEALAGQAKEDLRARLGLDRRRPIAVLSLAYQTPSGETPVVRERLLNTVSQGLPADFQLLVKPHPAEADGKIDYCIARFAPQAKVADKYTPIAEILSIADVLFNRGNSQVVIDALRRKIPVIAVPEGRGIFLDGILDQVIARDKSDIRTILALVREKGFTLYEPALKAFFAIDPGTALSNTAGVLKGIIAKGELRDPGQRLLDLVLYWSWAGYPEKAVRLISELTFRDDIGRPLLDALARLAAFKATTFDLEKLRAWGRPCYRNWLLQCLWIKTLYLKQCGLAHPDKEWLADFPPRMNREYFVSYACMLGWCYLVSGMRQGCRSLLDVIGAEYGFLKQVQSLKKGFDRGFPVFLDPQYLAGRLSYSVKSFVKRVIPR